MSEKFIMDAYGNLISGLQPAKISLLIRLSSPRPEIGVINRL